MSETQTGDGTVAAPGPRRAWAPWAVVAFFVIVYLAPLGVRPLMSPDEPRYAEMAREVLSDGNWSAPRLAGLRYFEKPPLGTWVKAASVAVLGPTRFAVRLPAALGAGLSALLVALLLVRGGHGRETAAVGALSLLTTLLVYGLGTTAILDSFFGLLVTASLTSAYLATQAERPRTRRWWLAAFGVMCGLGLMTKGFLALALPVVVIVPYQFWQRRPGELLRMCWLPMLSCAIVVAPWAVAVARAEPGFWYDFIMVEHVRRFFSGEEAQHAEPFWFYLPVILAAGLPWTALLVDALLKLRGGGYSTPLVRWSLCWLVMPFLLFSASSGKLPTYVIPCFPPLIILVVLGMGTIARGRDRGFERAAVALAVPALIGMVAIAAVRGGDLAVYDGPGELWKTIAVILGLGVWAVMLDSARRVATATARAWRVGAGLAPLLAIAPFILPSGLEGKTGEATVRAAADRVDGDVILVADATLAPLACWVFDRTDVIFISDRGELNAGLAHPDAAHRLIVERQFRRLVKNRQRSLPVVLVAKLSPRWGPAIAIPTPSWELRRENLLVAIYDPPALLGDHAAPQESGADG